MAQILNSRKHLVFFLIIFIVTLMLQSSMAFEFPSFPLVNNSGSFPSPSSATTVYNPPISFSSTAYPVFIIIIIIIIIITVFLIAITFDFIAHTFKFPSPPLQKNTPQDSDSLSGTLICRRFSSRFSFSNVNLNRLSPVLTNCISRTGISWIDKKLETNGTLSMNVQQLMYPTQKIKFGVENRTETPLCFSTNSIASRFMFSDVNINRFSPGGLSFFGGLATLDMNSRISVWMDSRTGVFRISWIDRKNLKPENLLINGTVDQQLLYPTQKIKFGVENRTKTPLRFSENRTNSITSGFTFSNINLNSIDYISMGMDLRTSISFTSWTDHDPKNLKAFLSSFKPVNVLLKETELGSAERSDMKRLNPRIDQLQTASTSTVPTQFPDNHMKMELGVYGSVSNFDDLMYIRKEVISVLDWGQKALKPENNSLACAVDLNNDPEKKIFLEAEEGQIVQIQKKQAAAAGNQKRDTRLKSLKAAEATKLRLEKVEIEREKKKQAFQAEIARRKALKPENKSLAAVDLNNDPEKIFLEAEECQIVQKQKNQAAAAAGNQKRDTRLKSLKAAEATKLRLEKVEIEREKKKQAFQAEIARRKAERAMILENEEKLKKNQVLNKNKKFKFEREYVKTVALSGNKKKCVNLSQTKKANEKQALKVKVGEVKFCSEESSYIISPCHSNPYSLRKFIPSWASENHVAMALPLQQKVDPESIFRADSFCSVDEVLLPWESG